MGQQEYSNKKNTAGQYHDKVGQLLTSIIEKLHKTITFTHQQRPSRVQRFTQGHLKDELCYTLSHCHPLQRHFTLSVHLAVCTEINVTENTLCKLTVVLPLEFCVVKLHVYNV